MSGEKLCSLLGELGYEGAEFLDSESFEWPFQYEDAKPILDWICSSLRPSNVLSLSEVSQYEQFLEEVKLLEGDVWKLAFTCLFYFSPSLRSIFFLIIAMLTASGAYMHRPKVTQTRPTSFLATMGVFPIGIAVQSVSNRSPALRL